MIHCFVLSKHSTDAFRQKKIVHDFDLFLIFGFLLVPVTCIKISNYSDNADLYNC